MNFPRHCPRTVKLVAISWSLSILSSAVDASIGATDEECTKLYGVPTAESRHTDPKLGSRLTRIFSWNGFDVAAQFRGESTSELQCVSICYRTQQPSGRLTQQEIEKLLTLNGKAGAWKGVDGVWAYRGWIAQRNRDGDTLTIRRVVGEGDSSFPGPMASLPVRSK